jgi:O-antigen/teichoic acid export membrane protein
LKAGSQRAQGPEGQLVVDLSSGEAADVKTVAKGGALQVAGQIAQKGFTFLFIAASVRMIGAAGYGLYREVFQILMIGTTIAAAGFPYGALRFIARARALKDPGGVRGAARVTLRLTGLLGGAIFFIVFFGAELIASRFSPGTPGGQSELSDLLRIGAAFIPAFALVQVLRSCTQAYKTMVPAVVVGNIIQPVGRLLLGVAALLLGFGAAGLVSALTFSAFLSLGAGSWYYFRLLTEQERRAKPHADLGEIVRFTIPQAGAKLFSTSSLGIGIILLGLYASNREVGLFGVAMALQLLGNVFLTGVVAIFSPVVVDLYERSEIDRLKSIYQTVNRWIATLSFPIFAILIVMPTLFAVLLGGKEAAGAAALIPILALGNLFYVGTGPSGYLLSMTGRPVLNLANSLAAVALYVALGVWAARTYGAFGVAWVEAIVTVFVNVVRLVEIKVLIGVQPWGKTFVKPVAASVAGIVVLGLWSALVGTSTALAVVGIALFGVVYVGVLKMMRMDPEERHVFEQIKTKGLNRFRRKGRG